MFSKFLNLQQEKQERILDAAMKEFAQKGFENASTNAIIKEADISKGLLFYYFKNKKSLFLFLYDYCINLYINEFYKKINMDETDIFIKLRQCSVIKLELLMKYAAIFIFIEVAYRDKSENIKSDLELINKELSISNYNKIFKNMNTSKFKKGLDTEKCINIIMWTLEGFGAQITKNEKLLTSNKEDYQKAFDEADLYMNVLKNCFYK
ncbi:TetR/AcrR family transcriptional regulator [Clostridium algoriphilum]|uniref:TetR/AcrR family transcriptional regulator n=1 Tax=Clostridium algoriphilum TaxID=198347 RepID=UPI001CF3D134|nr:TetR/AcrR family transcriptional regulator [Clostridium algoriphilum]MCB2293330.1 TetR/AcrR family transcriptional regulator [Clostridium algoriphilum]